MPEEGVHLWEWFWQISNARPDNEKPINYRDLNDWVSVTRNLVNGQEIEILFAMDQAFRQTLANEIKANTARAEALRSKG